MNFSENLHFLLESRGILIKELSAKTGISENTLKTYLRTNCVEPTLSKALLIADALNVSLEFLANGTELAEITKKPAKKIPDETKKLLALTENFSKEDFHILLATAKAIQENKDAKSSHCLDFFYTVSY